jgi:hypothetical protein
LVLGKLVEERPFYVRAKILFCSCGLEPLSSSEKCFWIKTKCQDTSSEVAEKHIVFDGVIFPATFFCRQHSPLSLFVATPERLEHTPALLLHHRNQLDHA